MEQLWVALLAVGTTLLSSGIGGSVLHGISSGPGYLQWIPHELIYTNVHSPLVLSQHHHSLRADEALAVRENRQGQFYAPGDESLIVARNGKKLYPASVTETSPETSRRKFITQEQLYEQIFGPHLKSSEGSNAIKDGIISTAVKTVRPSPMPSKIKTPPTVPQSTSKSSLSKSSVTPTPIAPEKKEPLNPSATIKNSLGKVDINAEKGKLQMQASLGDGVKVTVGDVPNVGGDFVSVTVPKLPASSNTKDSRSHIITNVNVHLNVNGDGKGSVINSTSVAKLTAPIKTDHTQCD